MSFSSVPSGMLCILRPACTGRGIGIRMGKGGDRNKEDREGRGKIGIRRKGNRRGRRDSNKEDTEGKGS